MKLHFLGTCAGTEPMPDRKHASFALETQGRLYWFDAGEGCSYTAHNLGLDLLKVCRIIISHPHMDHVGGLGNLLWNIRKLCYVRKSQPAHGDIHVHIPNLSTWEAILTILRNAEGGFAIPFGLEATRTQDGLLFDDGYLRVTAWHNTHIPQRDGQWQAFSFLIECEGKRVVYSGDVGAYEELDAPIGSGCDVLIVETGHFKIHQTHAYASTRPIQKTCFTHNGREFLHFPEESAEKVRSLFGDKAIICYDGLTMEL